MLENHRYLLIKFRDEIATDLLVDDVLVYLESKRIVDTDDKEIVRSELTPKRKAEKLLDILPTKGYEAFGVFFKILGEKYAHLAELLKSGVGNEDYGNMLDYVDSPSQLERMTDLHNALLITNRVEIVEDLLVNDVLNYLQSKFVFDTEDVDTIRSEITPRRQAEKLLDLLATKGDSAFYHFKGSLDEPYPHLAELLEEDGSSPRKGSVLTDIQEQVESVLLEGGVPQRPDVFTNRARDVHRVRTALRSLQDHDGWVILHGMAGCGKTVLAADAIRHSKILAECFPGGVFWIRIGPVDQSKLLMKMQNLCTQLDSDHVRAPPRNLEEAKDRLRIIFAHQHPRTLLVLDDLWNANDVRYFDIRVRIIVTTRDASITNSVSGNKIKVHVSEGFTDKEALEILSSWTGTAPINLPPEARSIVTLTKGSPLAITMIGALLREHPTRWSYYLKQLQKKKVGKLKTTFAYQYPTLSEAISMSISNLSEDLQKRYQDFALFEDGIKVPAQVLCILWDEEFEEVEDMMDELVNKSLARKTVQSDSDSDNSTTVWYSVHNLQLTFLREHIAKPQELHRKLVERYLDVYDGKFEDFENDDYIHWYLVQHMQKAGMTDEAFSLLVDLCWLSAKLKITGPADLISDYIGVSKCTKNQESLSKLDAYHHFVSTNAHLFVGKPLPNIIQLALQEPQSGPVYQQAKKQALGMSRKGKLFLDWSNWSKGSLDSSLQITAKVHDGAVYKCQFSSDALKVVSCGTDNKVKVWESQSGRELNVIDKHTDVVNCCSFSNDNKRIISCSADQTVRIWDSINGNELLCFRGHAQEVFCCCFSPDDENIISCSADKTVKIWESRRGVVKLVLIEHMDIVRWCCYSPDGDKVASCSDDTTVKVFEANTGRLLISLEDHVNSVSFCSFMNKGKNIVAVSNNCVKVMDCVTGKEVKNFNASSNCLCLDFAHDDSIVAMGFSDATVQLWNTSTYASLGVFRGHTGWVHTVAFSNDGLQLMTGSDDETIKIWSVDSNTASDVKSLRRVFDVYFTDDSVVIAIADTLNKLLLYEGFNGVLTHESEPMDFNITSISFTADGLTIAIGLENGSVKICDRTCKVLHSFHEHSKKVRRLAFSSNGKDLISASDDFSCKMYTISPSYGFIFSLDGHQDKIKRCRFFAQDAKVITASLDGTLKVWEAQTGTLDYTCCHSNQDYLLTCDVSKDSKLLVSACVDRYAKVWDASSGSLLQSFGPHNDVVRSVSISPDSNLLCTGCDDGSVKVWDIHNGVPLAETPKQNGWVTDCQFSPDGKGIVAVSDNLYWWSSECVLKQVFFIKGGFSKDISFSNDYKTFVTIDDTSTLFILRQL